MIELIKNRIYQNYFMKSRVPVFQDLLKFLQDTGYIFMTANDLVENIQSGQSLPDRTAIVRCDVDSDVRTAMLMLEAASKQGVSMSWYWRLATLNSAAMLQVMHAGHENGYHFEELATIAKRRGARTQQDIDRLLPEMRAAFCHNIEEKYAQAAGSFPKTISSHGDFANRVLKQTNSILVDPTIRKRYGIVADISYDLSIYAFIKRCFGDVESPHWWEPSAPIDAPVSGPDVIHILVHPRQYHSRIVENTMLDIERFVEGIAYAVRRRVSAHA